MSTHTPGPWSWKDGIQLVVGKADDVEGEQIAIVQGDPPHEFGNARLIAAAPELLEACELAQTALKAHGIKCGCENSPVRCAICALKEAITKAKATT